MRTKPVASIPITPSPARGICPVEARPKRCARGLCRRQRACAHPPAPGTLHTAAGPVIMDAKYQEFVSLVLSLVDTRGKNPLEIIQAGEAAKARRSRKAARRAKRAGPAAAPARVGAAEPGATRRTGPTIRAL